MIRNPINKRYAINRNNVEKNTAEKGPHDLNKEVPDGPSGGKTLEPEVEGAVNTAGEEKFRLRGDQEPRGVSGTFVGQ